ncbi:hypothetical protein Droror1_Dr00006148 [Drosera rotundifolia]
MEAWVPLFNIFLKSLTPESEASLWLQRSFNPSSTPSITTNSFISLLTRSVDAIVSVSSPQPSSPLPASSSTQRVMWIETLPGMVQARILSFLAYEHESFCAQRLVDLARSVLEREHVVDFWVRWAAQNLLDKVSESCRGMDCRFQGSSGNKAVEDEFYELPSWLKDAATDNANDFFLPWLPLPVEDALRSGMAAGSCVVEKTRCFDGAVDEGIEDEVMVDSNEVDDGVDSSIASLDPDVRAIAASMSAQLQNFDSASKVIDVADEIRQLCVRRKGDALGILELVQPWKAEDEAVAILLSHTLDDTEELELGWRSQVLCATVLPKLLVLEEPASRVLVSTTIEFCKLHQRAVEYALLYPLILKKGGINSPICDVITRIMRESLHTAHIASFCQKLLGRKAAAKTLLCLPCHRVLLSDELIWTESLFGLFQNILNHNVHLTQDSVDQLVSIVHQSAATFSKSLKFGNFLLSFMTKCSSMLTAHALQLTEAVKLTNTLVTKSILTKLGSL